MSRDKSSVKAAGMNSTRYLSTEGLKWADSGKLLVLSKILPLWRAEVKAALYSVLAQY